MIWKQCVIVWARMYDEGEYKFEAILSAGK